MEHTLDADAALKKRTEEFRVEQLAATERLYVTGESALSHRWEPRALFEAEYPAVVRHLIYLTGDRDLAEDLAQEAFGKLLDRGPAVDLRSPRAWLLRVASNLAVNAFRSESRRADREAKVAPAEPVTEDVAESVAVRDALAHLEPRDRAVLLLRNAGFSYAEIAEAVGLQASSIGTTIARAQRRFRELYEPRSEDPAPSAVTCSETANPPTHRK